MSDEPKKLEESWPGGVCDICGKIATLTLTDVDPSTGKLKTLHFCLEHGMRPDELAGVSKCRECGRPAILHMTDVDQNTGEAESYSLCEEHGRQFL